MSKDSRHFTEKGSIWLYFCLRPLSSFEAESTCHLLVDANVNTRSHFAHDFYSAQERQVANLIAHGMEENMFLGSSQAKI